MGEELEQRIPMLEQDMHGLVEPSFLDNEVMRDSDNEHYETTGPHVREAHCATKGKTWAAYGPGEHPQGAPNVTEYTMYRWYS